MIQLLAAVPLAATAAALLGLVPARTGRHRLPRTHPHSGRWPLVDPRSHATGRALHEGGRS